MFVEKLFDIGVNMGLLIGIKFMQWVLNVLNQNEKMFLDILVDGGIGLMIIMVLKVFLQQCGVDGYCVLYGMIVVQQFVFYIEFVECWLENEKFEYGWQFNCVLGV